MTKHYKQFKLDPYPCSLRVYIDREAFDKAVGESTTDMGAATYRNGGLMAVFIPADENGNVSIRSAAHEAYHVADFVKEHVEMEYKHNSGNEHIAYLVGHVCECIAIAAGKLTKPKQDAAT
jgi:hypothetical protein